MTSNTVQEGIKAILLTYCGFLGELGRSQKLVQKWLGKAREGNGIGAFMVIRLWTGVRITPKV